MHPFGALLLVALCATAAGTLRLMLANMTPWASYRRTYGAAIDTRELVRRRIGRMAALIVGCDALTDWCAGLLDEGFRGEMECVVAKIFASDGLSFQFAAATMTGMSQEEYAKMMLDGGRSPDGNRYIGEKSDG